MGVDLNSVLFECDVRHTRTAPKPHKISFRSFMFYLDLDELAEIRRRVPLVGINEPRLYSFYERDHLPFGQGSLKENLKQYLRLQKVDFTLGKVMLLTNLRVFGYVFNPISVFYCYDAERTLQAIVVEVGNTFNELKPYLLTRNDLKENDSFEKNSVKNFYVSPFAQLNHTFSFKLKEPNDRMAITINTMDGAKPVVLASVTGDKLALTDRNLGLLSLKFPFNTLRVIAGIHWHAFLLFLKGLSFEEKESNIDLQTDVLRPHVSLRGKSGVIPRRQEDGAQLRGRGEVLSDIYEDGDGQ